MYTKILVIASSSVALSSCFPQGQNSNIEALAGPVQTAVINNKVAKLDKVLAGPIENKRIMEDTARRIKTEYADNPEVLLKGKNAYNVANGTLKNLKSSIKSDIRNGAKNSSVVTTNYAEKYSQDVQNLKQVYVDASGIQDKSISLIGAIGIIQQGFAMWTNYDSAKKSALIENVDHRLSAESWKNVQ